MEPHDILFVLGTGGERTDYAVSDRNCATFSLYMTASDRGINDGVLGRKRDGVPLGLSTIFEEEILVPASGVSALACRSQFTRSVD